MTTSYTNTVEKCQESWAEEVNAFMATVSEMKSRKLPRALEEDVNRAELMTQGWWCVGIGKL